MNLTQSAANPLWGDLDSHLFAEGNHLQLYNHLGAHRCSAGGAPGVNFAVWAPGAQSVSVVGAFNGWNGSHDPMSKDAESGIWHRFIPGVAPGDLYKFRIADCNGRVSDKTDPFGFWSEVPPATASLVADLDQYHWHDNQWISERTNKQPSDVPISIYEVHLGSWQTDANRPNGWMNYRELAHRLVDYCLKMNFTHVELLPVSEHPYTPSWGYQTVGYFSVTSRYGKPEDFMYFVDYCHQNGIGVIVDWVPAHFPRDAHGLRRFDGTGLYEHIDPRQGEHPDWGTMIFNFGRARVRNFLLAGALFWLDKYHVDGLRVDAVASMLYLDYSRKEGEWVPNQFGGRENLQAIEFLRQFNQRVHAQFPGVLTIAEESTAWPGVSHSVDAGGLGFDLKWNMGWMNDTLKYIRRPPVYRQFHHNELTFSMMYAFAERFVLPLSHDEVVHGKKSLIDQMPGDVWQKFANLRLLYGYMWTHPGKKTLFMGSEFGQWLEWNCEQPLQWQLLEEAFSGHPFHRGLQALVRDLNALYCRQSCLHRFDFRGEGFQWIDCHNRQQSTLSYFRGPFGGEQLVIACNFTPAVHRNFRLGLPRDGTYSEILNSDSAVYGGSDVVNQPKKAEALMQHGQPFSMSIVLPPLAMCVWQRSAHTSGGSDPTESSNRTELPPPSE